MKSFVRWLLALFTTAKPPDPEPQRPSPLPAKGQGLTRRQLFTVAAGTLGAAHPIWAILPTPADDPGPAARAAPDGPYRYGWITLHDLKPAIAAMESFSPEPRIPTHVFYGLNWETAEDLVIWLVSSNHHSRPVTLQELTMWGFREYVAEIGISQAHRGLMLTGGLAKGEDDWDPDNPWPQEVLLTGSSDRDVEMAVQRLAHRRDATEAEMDQAEEPLYRFFTGLSQPPYTVVIDEMVDEETYGKLDNIAAEQWPLIEDQIARMKALVA